MLILIPTIAVPPQRNIRTELIHNLIPHLTNKTSLEIIWLSIKPDRIKTHEYNSEQIINIHDFSDANSLLKKIKPDCVIISAEWESIQYSLSIACKSLSIPLISFFIYNYELTLMKAAPPKDWQSPYLKFRRFFLSTTGDDNTNKKFMKRGRSFISKYIFLMKTKQSVGSSWFKILKDSIHDFSIIILSNHPSYNELCDAYFLPDDSWIKPLTKLGFEKNKLHETGNPFWDKIYHKIHDRKIPEPCTKGKINILILTDSLIEHGVWSKEFHENYFKKLFLILNDSKKFSYSLKIHPATENLLSYQSLLKKLNKTTKIYQRENLWDIIDDFDIIVSFGSTTAHTELSCMGVKLILLNLDDEYILEALVDEGIQNGHIISCKTFDDLIPSIEKLLKNKIELSEEFKKIRSKLIFKFNGTSGEKMSNVILNRINKL